MSNLGVFVDSTNVKRKKVTILLDILNSIVGLII